MTTCYLCKGYGQGTGLGDDCPRCNGRSSPDPKPRSVAATVLKVLGVLFLVGLGALALFLVVVVAVAQLS